MAPNAYARAIGMCVVAASYATIVLWLAATGVANLFMPLNWGVAIVAPAAVGLLLALATDAPRALPVIVGAPLLLALAGALAVTLGWLPLAYFGFAGVAMLTGVLLGAIAGVVIGDAQVRGAAALVVAVAPALVGRFETPRQQAPHEVTVISLADLAAPAVDAWEEVIGSDSVVRDTAAASDAHEAFSAVASIAMDEPRPSSPRQVVYADGTRLDERVIEWEDAEWLRVTTVPSAVVIPTGLAAWRAGRGEGSVMPVAATWELAADGDKAAALTLRGIWRLAMHPRAYPAAWLTQVAQAKNNLLAATVRRRADARARAGEPLLTAEMRVLRRQLARDLAADSSPATGTVRAVSMLMNAERVVERVAAFPPVGLQALSAVEAELRANLRRMSARARTTGWALRVGDAVHFEFEDYNGRCVSERAQVASAGAGGLERPTRRALCEPDAMAERARRSRVIAQLALSAGDPTDRWSIVPLVRGIARVYLDSVVLRADTLQLRVGVQETTHVTVDSIVAGLSNTSGSSWNTSIHGSGRALNQTFAVGQVWNAPRARFVIPADSTVDLTRVWPTFEVVLAVPRTDENTIGRAWTYAHAPKAFFAGVRR